MSYFSVTLDPPNSNPQPPLPSQWLRPFECLASSAPSAVGRALLVLALVTVLLGGPASAYAAPRQATPVEANGALQVVGNQIANQRGEPVQLRGVALHGLQWSGWFYEDPSSLRAAAKDWGADILRITVYVYEGGYLDHPTLKPSDFDQMIDGYIAQCVELGIYCILDWHVHHPGNPLHYTEDAKIFFERYSKKYANVPNIVYEIANEPNRTGYDKIENGSEVTIFPAMPTPWNDIKTYAEAVIPVIRKNAPDSLVLVGTPSWSQLGHSDGYTWQEIDNNRVPFENTAYVVHFYSDGHNAALLDHYKQAAAKLPLFATEWSPAHYSLSEPFRGGSGKPWVDWMNSAGIGGTYWMWAAGDDLWSTFDKTTTATGPFAPSGANVSESGRFLYEWLSAPKDAWDGQLFDPSQTPPDGTPKPVDGEAPMNPAEDNPASASTPGLPGDGIGPTPDGSSAPTPGDLNYTNSGGSPSVANTPSDLSQPEMSQDGSAQAPLHSDTAGCAVQRTRGHTGRSGWPLLIAGLCLARVRRRRRP